MMDFFIPYCKRISSLSAVQRPWRIFLNTGLGIFLVIALHVSSFSQQALQSGDFGIQPEEDGYYLQATFDFDLPLGVEEALNKGVPLFFVAEVDVFKERWYWSDKLISHNERHMRLSYQPLTRRWRIFISSQPIANNGLGVAMGQSFDTLADAMALVKRVTRWKIAQRQEINPSDKYRYNFNFRLDLSQLPRPLQMGAIGDSEWALSFTRSQRLAIDPPAQ
jgi:Domain of unknown function (DUF4390)